MQPADGPTSRYWKKRLIVGFLILVSLAVYGIWTLNFVSGSVQLGETFAPTTTRSLPFLHYLAEFLMATVTLIGAIALARNAPWASGVTLLGLGMFIYSAINSLGWAVVNDQVQGIPMFVTLIAALIIAPYLIRRALP